MHLLTPQVSTRRGLIMTNDLLPSINTSLTNFISEHSKTVKTDKTDVVDNHAFLQAIFGKQLNGHFH